MLRLWQRAVLVAAALATGAAATAETVTVAVASNFSTPLVGLVSDFERESGHAVRVVSGSTGRLYAQILNGAPFDVFLAADAERPTRLEAESLALPGSRHTYATGTLVLWSADPAIEDCLAALESLDRGRLAIANPLLAPYGRAARQFLDSSGLWPVVENSLVTGENVAQVAQFVATGNARMGFVAKSQLGTAALGNASCSYEVPAEAHAPIEQQLVRLNRSAGSKAAAAFVAYLMSERVQRKLVELGYRAAGGLT